MKVLASTLALAIVPALAAPISDSAEAVANAAGAYEVSTVESLPGTENGAAWLFSASAGPNAGQGTTLKFYEKNELSSSGKGRAWVVEIDDSADIKSSALARYAEQFRPLPQGKRAQQLPPPPKPYAPLGQSLARPGSGLGAGTLAGARTNTPGNSYRPATPAYPAAPRVPGAPAHPAYLGAPRVPAQPAAPRVPGAPAAPRVPAHPAAPRLPAAAAGAAAGAVGGAAAAAAIPAAPRTPGDPAVVAASNVAPEQLPDIGGLLGSLPIPAIPDIGGLLGNLPVVGPLLGGAKSGGAPAAPSSAGAPPGSIVALTTQIGEQIGDRIGQPIGSAIGSRIGKAIGQPIGSTIGGAIGQAITSFLPPPS